MPTGSVGLVRDPPSIRRELPIPFIEIRLYNRKRFSMLIERHCPNVISCLRVSAPIKQESSVGGPIRDHLLLSRRNKQVFASNTAGAGLVNVGCTRSVQGERNA